MEASRAPGYPTAPCASACRACQACGPCLRAGLSGNCASLQASCFRALSTVYHSMGLLCRCSGLGTTFKFLSSNPAVWMEAFGESGEADVGSCTPAALGRYLQRCVASPWRPCPQQGYYIGDQGLIAGQDAMPLHVVLEGMYLNPLGNDRGSHIKCSRFLGFLEQL